MNFELCFFFNYLYSGNSLTLKYIMIQDCEKSLMKKVVKSIKIIISPWYFNYKININ